MSSRGDSRDDRDRYDRDKDRYNRDRDDRYDGQAASPSRRDRLRSRSPARRDREKDRDSRDDRDDRAPDRDRRSIDKRDSNRDRSRSRSRDRRDDRRSSKHHRSKRSPSESDSESDSEDEERRRRRKKEKARRRDRSESDSESEGERAERKRRKKEKKVRKKEKKDKKKTSSSTAEWGKYGIIDDNDRQAKEAEFRSWMVEERMINPETLKKDKEKKEWAVFVEDFNTATLPHEKYYNMMAYSQKMDILRTGGTLASSVYDPNADMQAHSSSLRRPIIETETYLSKSQLEDLRRVQNERVEFGKRKTLGMDVSKTLGVRMDGSKFDAGRK